MIFLIIMIQQTPSSTLFPYTTLFRSERPHLAREKQDEFALRSHRLAIAAIDEGRFAEEIVPVPGAGIAPALVTTDERSEEHTSELQSRLHLVCRLLLEKKKEKIE